MSRRQKHYGVSTEVKGGKLRLRFRVRDGEGRWRQVARSTGLDFTIENETKVENLRRAVSAALRAGRSLVEIDAALEAVNRPPSNDVEDVVTVESYYRPWIEEVAPNVRKALARDYRRHFNGYIIPLIGQLPIDLRPRDIRGLQAELLARAKRDSPGRTLSVKTVKNVILGSLAAMHRQARVDELATRNPFPDLVWPAWQYPEPDPFNKGEVHKILEWFADKRFGFRPLPGSRGIRRLLHPPFHGYIHALFKAGGLRPSEASGLQWRDVDLKRGVLYVRRSYHLGTYGAPKTRSARRTVLLLPETRRVLSQIQPLRVVPEMPVFTSTTGRPIEPKAFSEHWYRCLRALGLRVRGLYCAKDTFVSLTLPVMGAEWVEAQTGVAYATLKRHYARWMPTGKEAEVQRLEEALAPEPSASLLPLLAVAVTNRDVSYEEIEVLPMRGGGFEPPRVLPH